MSIELLLMFAGPLAAVGGVAILTWIGFRWGVFAALKAKSNRSPKWKAYVLALLPPAAFALTLLFDVTLSPLASETFWALAAPAFIGTCLRYNRNGYSTC